MVRSTALLALGFISAPAFGQEAVQLRYKFEPNASLLYKVEIKADEGEEIEVQFGTPEFKVVSADAKGAKVLLASTQLGKRTERKPGARAGVRFPTMPSMRFPRTPIEFTGHELTYDERGNVVQERGSSSISYMLGNLPGLLFEPFPEKAVATWNRSERTTISILAQTGRIPSPFREEREQERLTAEESTTFTVQEVTPEAVKLKREHTIKTFEKTDDGPRLELDMVGIYHFDRASGLPQDIAYDGKLISRKDNVTVKAPLSVVIHRLSDEEVKLLRDEQARLAAEAKARAEQAALERKVPLTAEERGTILANLQDSDNRKIRDALTKLEAKDPANADKEIGFNVALLLTSSDVFVRTQAAKVLEQWATPDQANDLAKALSDSHVFAAHGAFRALAKLKEPQTFPAIAAKLSELGLRSHAADALKKIGPTAEPEVLKYLDHKDWTVRMEACNILKEIGTEKSLPLLKTAATSDENGVVKSRAKSAAEEVGKRK